MFSTKLMSVREFLLGIGAIGASLALADEDKEGPKKQDDKKRQIIEAARQRSAKNLQELMIALWNYHEINDHFAPAANYDKAGKPLLSWRVLLLPYLDQDDLFAQFHLDEPWDSKHNKPLLAKMPKQYEPPLPGKTKEKYTTFYQVFVGKGAFFEGKEGMTLSDVTDGTSMTIAIIEAGQAVPWTKPVDLPYDAKKPLPKLGGLFDDGINAAFADGSAHWLRKDFDAAMMRIVITRNGADILLDPTKLEK
jgi:hypothetical protein